MVSSRYYLKIKSNQNLKLTNLFPHLIPIDYSVQNLYLMSHIFVGCFNFIVSENKMWNNYFCQLFNWQSLPELGSSSLSARLCRLLNCRLSCGLRFRFICHNASFWYTFWLILWLCLAGYQMVASLPRAHPLQLPITIRIHCSCSHSIYALWYTARISLAAKIMKIFGCPIEGAWWVTAGRGGAELCCGVVGHFVGLRKSSKC